MLRQSQILNLEELDKLALEIGSSQEVICNNGRGRAAALQRLSRTCLGIEPGLDITAMDSGTSEQVLYVCREARDNAHKNIETIVASLIWPIV